MDTFVMHVQIVIPYLTSLGNIEYRCLIRNAAHTDSTGHHRTKSDAIIKYPYIHSITRSPLLQSNPGTLAVIDSYGMYAIPGITFVNGIPPHTLHSYITGKQAAIHR